MSLMTCHLTCHVLMLFSVQVGVRVFGALHESLLLPHREPRGPMGAPAGRSRSACHHIRLVRTGHGCFSARRVRTLSRSFLSQLLVTLLTLAAPSCRWGSALDTFTQRVYYFRLGAQESQWERPRPTD